jgi:biofilm protein TabA
MIYKSDEGVYVFGFDDLADNASKADNLFEDLEEALEFCQEKYNADNDRWINIEDPQMNCQHDWIQRVRIKGKEEGKPEWGQFEQLINGRWTKISKEEKVNSFGAMTGNERLWVSGLMTEFDKSLKKDKSNAERILRALQWDEPSLKKILQ